MEEMGIGEGKIIRQRRAPQQRYWRRNGKDKTGEIRNPKSQMENKSGHGMVIIQRTRNGDPHDMEKKMAKEVGSGGVERKKTKRSTKE